MLYVTTRDKKTIHTSFRSLSVEQDEKGGLFVPFQLQHFSDDELALFQEKPFCQCVADVLNIFFSARLDAWDVACCIGTHPLKLIPMSHKITIAEIWNNPEWSISRFVRNLNGRILGNTDNGCPSSWIEIAVRIAVLVGILSKLMRIGLADIAHPIDISVSAGDLSAPMAAWYTRQMGLPVGNIIISCYENSAIWDLFHHGELNTNLPIIHSETPLSDERVLNNLERLINEILGDEETKQFIGCTDHKSIYILTEEYRDLMRDGMFCAVIGKKRIGSIIRNVYNTSTYLLSPFSALAYGGLQDYRSTKGESRQALILTEYGPLYDSDTVANAIGITKESLLERVRTV